MNEDCPLNNGENHKNFPLARRPSSAVEKAMPGAKRILSGMVADALALAKKQPPTKRVIRVLTCTGDQDMSQVWQEIIQEHLGSGYIVEVTDKGEVTEILELVNQQSFDIIIPLINNILAPIPVDFDGNYFENRVRKAVELFTRLKAQFDIPIIALCGAEPNFNLPERLKLGGIDAFFWYDRAFFDSLHTEFLPAVETALKIPRDTSTPALAKAEPPVKPILSMLVGGGIIDGYAGLFEDILRLYLDGQYNLKVMARDNAVELIKLAERQPFDLFIIILNNVWQDLDKIQLDATDGEMWGDRVMFLKRLKMQFGKPIIALSGIETIEMSERSKRAGADVFLSLSEIGSVKGFQNEFLPALEAALKIKIPRDAVMQDESMPSKIRSPKIVVIDENPFPVELMGRAIKLWFKTVELKTFQNRSEGLQEISRLNPDLLILEIVNDNKLDFNTLQILADRKVAYPIVVTSGLESPRLAVDEFATKGLNVTFLPKPFTTETFLRILEAKLKILRDST